MDPKPFLTATTNRRAFLAGGIAGFGLWLISGTVPGAAATPPTLVSLDVPLWRSLAYTAHPGGASIQLRTGTKGRGMLIYGLDAQSAHALARFPYAEHPTISERVTGESVFAGLIKSGVVRNPVSELPHFQNFLAASVVSGLLMPEHFTQRVVTREKGATS